MGSERSFPALARWPAVLLVLLLSTVAQAALSSLDDTAMADVTGQALIFSNKQQGTGISSAVTFYTMGLDAQLALNANMGHLQLGCGGINPVTNGQSCDIDINNLAFSGIPGVNGCPSSGSTVGCDAVLTRPSITLAIANDGSPQRHLLGFQISAQSMSAQLTFGDNTSTGSAGVGSYGINSFSGYMTTTPLSGTAQTQATVLGGPSDGTVLKIGIDAEILACTTGCGKNANGTASNFAITQPTGTGTTGLSIPSQSVPFSTASGATVNGNRLTSTLVTANAVVPDIPITTSSGTLHAGIQTTICVLFFICVSNTNVNMNGTLHGLGVVIPFTENLGFIHVAQANGSPFYLSAQSTPIHWPGAVAADNAQTGWWMAFNNPVNLGTLNPTNQVSINPAFPQIANIIYNYFLNNPYYINTNAGLSALGGSMTANVGTINLSGNSINLPLTNLQIATQTPPGNCYGSSKFC